MKKLNLFAVSLSSLFCYFASAQENPTIPPYTFSHELSETLPTLTMPTHDFGPDIASAIEFQKMGNYPRIAKNFDINLNIYNSGVWSQLSNGDRVWRLQIKSTGALATCLFFDHFYLPEGATLHAYSPDHKYLLGSFTNADNQGNELFSTEFIKGDETILEYYEPASVKGQGGFRITSLAHQYRDIMADDCEVNIICSPEGDNWQTQKKGVVRVLVKEGADYGYCSGSLINNTALDCKRYILTAFHCGVDATTSDFNSWKFYFNYETTTCGGGDGGTLTNYLTGCVKRADSDDNGGDSGSDFLLLEMTSTSHPTWWTNVYWNGWNKSNTAPAANSVGIHHPAGTNKKISYTTGTATSSTWGGVPNTHWRVHWGQTTNGWGVTEGGSSGSPLFNTSGLIVGTLTGGTSYCNSVQANGQNQPDSYGKVYYHWTSDGTTSDHQLKPWLDPTNSGVSSLNGGTNPCNGVGVNEIMNRLNVMTIYPNPNNGTFTINVELENTSGVEFTVYNYTGQMVDYKKMDNTTAKSFSFSLSDKTPGLYFVHMKTDAYSEVKTIVISK